MIGENDLAFYKKKANWVRNRCFDMCIAGGGHLVSSFSCIDILVALYYGHQFKKLNADSRKLPDRDRFVLSKGHAASALYPILADLGYFKIEELGKYGTAESVLGSHPDTQINGIEATTGSLGHGLAIAAGMALSGKYDSLQFFSIALLGDGECSEGSVWETALFAKKRALNNLVAIIDYNKLCVTDFIEDCIGLDSLQEKWESFGWDVITIDGHNFEDIFNAFNYVHDHQIHKPIAIIAHTIKGKGISFMENNPSWHARMPSGEQIEKARKELLWSENG